MQIAIASSSGETVDQHFGKTVTFYIYSLNEIGVVLEEQREVTPLSTGDKNHPFDPERFTALFAKLSDCKRVYCTKIGDRPKEELTKRGIETIEFTGRIEEISL